MGSKHVLVVGVGEVGSHLAKVLSDEGHSVTVIDTDRERLQQATRDLDVETRVGDGSRPDVLERSDAYRADLLLAVSSDDNANMLACLFGKRIGAKRAVLRVRDWTAFRPFRTFFHKNLRLDYVLSLEDLAAEEIVRSIQHGSAVAVENFVDGKVKLMQLRVTEESPYVDKAIKDIELPAGTLIAAIERDPDVMIPDGNRVLEADDRLLVIGEPKGIEKLEKSLKKKAGIQPPKIDRVVVFGGSRVAGHVCTMLQRDHVSDIRLIVPDRKVAEEFAERLDHVQVIQGEGTDLNLLKQEHVGDSDAFLGLSRRDELNLMSCQLVKKTLGVARTVALVQKPDYVSIYRQLDIDTAVSPRLLCSNKILAYVRGGGVNTIATIASGKAEVIEVELSAGSTLVGKALADMGFPAGCRVGAIVRDGGDVLVPTGATVFEAHDRLVVFVLNDVKSKVLTMLGVGWD